MLTSMTYKRPGPAPLLNMYCCCWYSYSAELTGGTFFQHFSIMNILFVWEGELSKLVGDELKGGKKQEYDRLSKSSNAKDP